MIHLFTTFAGTLSNVSPGNLPNINANSSHLKSILDIVFGVLGALAFLMITISGFRYVISAGDPQKAAKAREGIIYSLVGLAVALTAGAIVNFVVGNI
jgi:hypothetical protein